MAKKILAGISGGVDSAVSALLLQRDGYEVIGCRLLLNDGAGASPDASSAQDVAGKLGIKLLQADFRDRFKKEVSDYFISEYLRGRTPNPCIKCNPTVKFAALLQIADENNIDFIATGHYAGIRKESDGLCAVRTSPSAKDQSYFLYRLPQNVLQRTVFPLGDFLSKEEIRETARQAGFAAAQKKDSQDICFIPDNDHIAFIANHSGVKAVPGDFLDADGKVIGSHSGIFHYTTGQRKGLGAFGEPRYVKYINAGNNTITLCKAEERFTLTAEVGDLFWTFGKAPDTAKEYGVKIRSTAKATLARLAVDGSKMEIKFSSPVMAPCPGQSAVVYDGDTVIGGGYIV